MEKQKLRIGDYGQIAEITGYAPETVRKVLNGVRNNETIKLAARELIEAREKLTERFSRDK